MPYNCSINDKELSEYQNELILAKEKNPKNPKLILDLYDKYKYVVYYKTLQFYKSMGIKIKKIHRIISFDEKAWLKPYINNNTENQKKLSVILKKIFGNY